MRSRRTRPAPDSDRRASPHRANSLLRTQHLPAAVMQRYVKPSLTLLTWSRIDSSRHQLSRGRLTVSDHQPPLA